MKTLFACEKFALSVMRVTWNEGNTEGPTANSEWQRGRERRWPRTDKVNDSLTNIHTSLAVILSVHRWKMLRCGFTYAQYKWTVYSWQTSSDSEPINGGQTFEQQEQRQHREISETDEIHRHTHKTKPYIIKVTYVQFYFILSGWSHIRVEGYRIIFAKTFAQW